MRCESGMYGRWAGGVVLDLERSVVYGLAEKKFQVRQKVSCSYFSAGFLKLQNTRGICP